MNRKIKILFVAVWLVVIFVFSAQPDMHSYAVSGSVSYRLVQLYDGLTGMEHTPAELEQMALRIEYPVRKAAHMSEYAVLAMLLLATFYAYSKKEAGTAKIRLLSLWSLAGVFFFACLDEFHQLFVQGREGKFTDVLIDAAGAAAALLVADLFLYMKMKKRKR